MYNSSCENKTEKPETPQATKGYYVLKRCGYVVNAGMGSGGWAGGLYHLHTGKQGKHMPGHNNYIEGRSIMYGDMNTIQGLLDKYAGKGQKIDANKERVDFNQIIGRYVSLERDISEETTMGIIHYSKDGAHIVPAVPKGE